MNDLTNYSVETDSVVLLSFKDGRSVRVAVRHLPDHLSPNDLERVKSALRLRRDFIRRHMPKAVIVLVAGCLVAVFLLGSRAQAHIWDRQPGYGPPVTRITDALDPSFLP